MRSILIAVVMAVSLPAWSASKSKFIKCQSYLLAPEELKGATKAILSIRTGRVARLKARQDIETYVNQSELNNNRLAQFLKHLTGDQEDQYRDVSSRSFAERQFSGYLMKQGNAEMALQNLPELLEIFWYDVVFGQEDYFLNQKEEFDRFKAGYGFTQKVLRFLKYLAQDNPAEVRNAWRSAYDKYLRLLIQIDGFERFFNRTASYLEQLKIQTPEEAADDEEYFEDPDDYVFAARHRLAYVTEIIAELDHAPEGVDADSLMKLYVIKDDEFKENGIYYRDFSFLVSSDLNSITPVRAFVFLVRLARVHKDLPQYEMQKIERIIDRIKRLKDEVPPSRLSGGPQPAT